MLTSWRVFTRDLKRLLRVPQAWIIVVGIIFTPALYAWFNIAAFWDPYSSTGNIRVAVVNLDEGASSEITGPVDVGAQVVERMRDNDQLGWDFMDQDSAMEAVRSGNAYAAIVIPENFSEDLLSITTGDFRQPALEYFVNEKANAIAPKITDVGATQLDRQITDAFIEQVVDAATEALKGTGASIQSKLLDSKEQALGAFEAAVKTVEDTRADVLGLARDMEGARGQVASVKATLGDVSSTVVEVQTAIGQAQSLIADAEGQVLALTDSLTTAYVEGATMLADSAAKANTAVSGITGALSTVNSGVGVAVSEADKVVQANVEVISQLESLATQADLPPEVAAQVSEIVASLQQKNQIDQQLLADLSDLNENVSAAIGSIGGAAANFEQATKNAQDAATVIRSALTDSVPNLRSAMSALSSSADAISNSLDVQRGRLDEAIALLTSIDTQMEATSSAVSAFGGDLANVAEDLSTARTDVAALGTASMWEELKSLADLDAQQIATFVASPVTVNENVVFPVNSYGSGMAALFTNLSLWIGAFVLMVVFKTEVDTEGAEGITIREAYFGRFLLFALIVAAQAVVVCVGDLILGVQTVSAVTFIFTGVFIALAYVSIIYALCVSFGHIGRGLCILLVIMQIPGASGLYPIEMMPGFFRAIYPFLPFTYGIDAMRETIAGFYDGAYWQYLGALCLFVALAFALGLALRSQLAQLNVMFNREIAATDLLVSEDVQVTGSGYRLSDVIRALSNRGEFREDLARRAKPFTMRYATLVKTAMLVGVTGLVVLGLIAWMVPEGKATLLGIWLLWCLLVIGFLVVLEYIKQSIEMAQEVAALDDVHLHDALGRAHQAQTPLPVAGRTTGVQS